MTVMVWQPGGESGFGWIYLKPANKSKVMKTSKAAWSGSEITFVTDVTLVWNMWTRQTHQVTDEKHVHVFNDVKVFEHADIWQDRCLGVDKTVFSLHTCFVDLDVVDIKITSCCFVWMLRWSYNRWGTVSDGRWPLKQSADGVSLVHHRGADGRWKKNKQTLLLLSHIIKHLSVRSCGDDSAGSKETWGRGWRQKSDGHITSKFSISLTRLLFAING